MVNLNTINGVSSLVPKSQNNLKMTPGDAQANFAADLKQAIADVNHSQKLSDQKTEALAKGEIDDLHDVMITAQKASVTLQTSVEVQNKVIDAYREIMRMQV
ncbi:flagellar hook-basal body complex protein FliE [Halobacillus sp. MO56]